jgi:16S rRNA (guanine(966)-N(2))-methyltransferase RsmD
MRIIAGSARGRPLQGPKHGGLRPTSDRVRQVLFDLLGQRFEGGAVLDLYCGTGALALEALSRGCGEALLVDSERLALELAGENAASLGFGAAVSTRKLVLPQGLSLLPVTPRRLIFADPPYAGAQPGLESLLRWVGVSGILQPGGFLVIEASRHAGFDPEAVTLSSLEHRLQRQVGDTFLHLFQRAGGSGDSSAGTRGP